MDKILLSNSDIEYVLKWRDEHQDLVRRHDCPLKAVRIVCTESGFNLTAIREGNTTSILVSNNGKRIGKLKFEILPFGMVRKLKDDTKLPQEDVQSVLTVYCSLMAMLVHGGVRDEQQTERKTRGRKPSQKKRKKQKPNGITYILHTSGGTRIAPQGSHRSPSGTFSVRGHYRHYRSGKVVWIEEYQKGDGKKKDKTYKIGRKE